MSIEGISKIEVILDEKEPNKATVVTYFDNKAEQITTLLHKDLFTIGNFAFKFYSLRKLALETIKGELNNVS